MAWSRTSLALVGFGFLIERFRLFEHLVHHQTGGGLESASFFIGLAFIAMGALLAAGSAIQYRRVLRTLDPVEIPPGYWPHMGTWLNVLLALSAIALLVLLALSGI